MRFCKVQEEMDGACTDWVDAPFLWTGSPWNIIICPDHIIMKSLWIFQKTVHIFVQCQSAAECSDNDTEHCYWVIPEQFRILMKSFYPFPAVKESRQQNSKYFQLESRKYLLPQMLPVRPELGVEVMIEDLHLGGGALSPPAHWTGLGREAGGRLDLNLTPAWPALPQHQRSLRLTQNWLEAEAAGWLVLSIEDGVHLLVREDYISRDTFVVLILRLLCLWQKCAL